MPDRLSLFISRPLNRCDCLVNRFLDQLNSIEEKRAKWSSIIITETLAYCLVHSFAHLHHSQHIKNWNTHKQLLKHNECFVIIAWYSTHQLSIDFVFMSVCVRVNVALSRSASCLLLSFQIVGLCEHLMWCRNRF